MNVPTPRAETVGSLLQPAQLLDARTRHASGELTAGELTAIEDEAVLAAISLQEAVGLDVITDGEMRRTNWADTRSHLRGLEPLPGTRAFPTNPKMAHIDLEQTASVFPVVVRPVEVRDDHLVGEEYPYLREHAAARTK